MVISEVLALARLQAGSSGDVDPSSLTADTQIKAGCYSKSRNDAGVLCSHQQGVRHSHAGLSRHRPNGQNLEHPTSSLVSCSFVKIICIPSCRTFDEKNFQLVEMDFTEWWKVPGSCTHVYRGIRM